MTAIRFDNRVALVTGAGGGIGRAHAIELASRGARVVVNDFNVSTSGRAEDTDRAQAVADEVVASGGLAVANRDSVADPAGAIAMVKAALDTWGRIDIIVNNAGIIRSDPVQDEPGPEYQDHMAVHLEGSLMTVRSAWPHFQRQGYGRVLNSCSLGVLGIGQGGRWFGSYPIAKAGILAATRQLAGAGADSNIKVNAILPVAYSRMARGGLDAGTAELMESFMRPEQVAAGASLLVHEDCPVSGQFLHVGGGRVARMVYASTLGFVDAELTAEKVRDNWSDVMGHSDGTHRLVDFYESGDAAFEYELFRRAGVGAPTHASNTGTTTDVDEVKR